MIALFREKIHSQKFKVICGSLIFPLERYVVVSTVPFAFKNPDCPDTRNPEAVIFPDKLALAAESAPIDIPPLVFLKTRVLAVLEEDPLVDTVIVLFVLWLASNLGVELKLTPVPAPSVSLPFPTLAFVACNW